MGEEVKIKRDPITVRLKTDVIALGRSLARSLHGSEDKLGNLIEDAISNMAVSQEDETRTSALLKLTEQTLFNRFDNQVESMYKALTSRDNKLTERIAGLLAVSSFETTLTELMLKELFIRDERTKARYEELRGTASKKMKDRYEKANVTEILELQEKIRTLEQDLGEARNTINDLQDNNASLAREKDDLRKKYQESNKEILKLKEELKTVFSALKAYGRLAVWYEKRDKDVPKIQDKNKKLLSKQPYEEALKEFEQQIIKPEVPRLGIDLT